MIEEKLPVFLHFTRTGISSDPSPQVCTTFACNAIKQKQHLQSLSQWLEAARHSNCQPWITASEWWGLHISPIRAQPNQKTNPCTARDQQIRFLPVCTWLNVLLSIIWVIYSSMRAEQTGLQGNLARFNTSSSLGSSISLFFFFSFNSQTHFSTGTGCCAGWSSISAARILSGSTEVVL